MISRHYKESQTIPMKNCIGREIKRSASRLQPSPYIILPAHTAIRTQSRGIASIRLRPYAFRLHWQYRRGCMALAMSKDYCLKWQTVFFLFWIACRWIKTHVRCFFFAFYPPIRESHSLYLSSWPLSSKMNKKVLVTLVKTRKFPHCWFGYGTGSEG